MTLEQRLEAQRAGLEQLELEIFLMPPDGQGEAEMRRRAIAGDLVYAWLTRVGPLDEHQDRAIISEVVRNSDERAAARMVRANRACWRATDKGQPLSWESFVLVSGDPWMDSFREAIREELDDPDTQDLEEARIVLRSFLGTPEEQMRRKGLIEM